MAFNLAQYLRRFNGVNNGHEYTLVCPICNRDKLVVNIEKGVWHCWICQEYKATANGKKYAVKGAGNIVSLVSLLENVDYKKAKEIVGDSYACTLGYYDTQGTHFDTYREIPFPEFSQRINYLLPYLIERGISLEDVNYFNLFYCNGGKYKNRLLFPVFEDGKLVFFQARAMWNTELSGSIKSMNSPKVFDAAGAEDVLFNLEKAAHYPRVVLTEGPIDAVHVGYNGIGTWGKHVTDKQIRKLYQYGIRAVDLMWDGPTPHEPKGAVPEMLQVLPKLSGLFDTRIIFLPGGDPGDYTRSDLLYFQKNALESNRISNLSYLE